MIIRENDTIKTAFKNSFIGRYILTKRNLLFLLLIIIATVWYITSDKLKTKGYTGLLDFATTVSSNYWNGRNANPETISIEIKDKDIKELEKNRQQALERGVIINDLDGDYVPATLEYQNKKIKMKLRLKGHMTDHLQNNKWSFRIKIKDKDSFMGMKRFSIQHPGTRGYIYEWIYHELMKREDIIALRYKFINVSVNGKDWGIYAVEENFEEELIENNQRPKGPILRFNPDLYWADRYNELLGSQPVAEYASYYSANIEAYREDKILQDSTQRHHYLKAMALMEGARNKKIPVDQAFDIEQLAKLHAIIDLVGGQHSIDWSDIKYYYNPVTQLLEPVAYESFTNFPANKLSGTYKFTLPDSAENYTDWHNMLFSNVVFFKAYIQQLEKISEPEYLDTFFNESNKELKNNLSILNKEFPYKKFDKQNYYNNQIMIKKLMNAPKAFHAYLKNASKTHIQIQIGPIESLPSEIHSITFGNTTLKPTAPIILTSKQPGQHVSYKTYDFPLSLTIWNDSLADMLLVNYSLLGASEMRTTKVFPFPHADHQFSTDDKQK
ncbi:MAG: CotH kinase family protein [Bacteroidota bacterium]